MDRIKSTLATHKKAVAAHFDEYLHWHVIGVCVIVTFKEFCFACVIDVIKLHVFALF
jgi:hypothetical protein